MFQVRFINFTNNIQIKLTSDFPKMHDYLEVFVTVVHLPRPEGRKQSCLVYTIK